MPAPREPPAGDERRMYTDLAWTWPLISPPEEYITEAEGFRRAILEHARIPVHSLLHLGCGGGHLDHSFKQSFQVTGVDLSQAMLDLARQLNPLVEYQTGDMRSIRLGRSFEAVVIADSIDYMQSEAELRAAFQTAHEHLQPGGVFCTVAELTRERFVQNETQCFSCKQGDIEIAFLQNRFDPNPQDSTCEATFVYLIRRAGELNIETDHHRFGLFPLATWQSLLAETGFEVHVSENFEQDPFFACLRF